MKKFKKHFLHCLLVSVMGVSAMSLQTHAELYKSVDEQGRVTYSDRKPDAVDDEKIIAIKELPAPEKKSRYDYLPIERPFDKTARSLLLIQPKLQWQDDYDSHRQIGIYSFGKSCGSPTSMLWPEVNFNHKTLLASSSDMAFLLSSGIRKMGYQSRVARENGFREQLEKFDGLILESEIVELDFHACAKNTRKTYRNQSLNRFGASMFNSNKVALSVSWKLFEEYGGPAVFEAVTKGYSDGRKPEDYGASVMKDALLNAAEGLFADQGFVDLLLVSRSVVQSAPQKQAEWSLGESFLHWLEQLWLGDEVGKRVLVAGVMNDLNSVKIQVFAAIAESGEVSEALAMQINGQTWSRGVKAVDVSLDGVITIELSDAFGPDFYLSLSPGDLPENFSDWQCSTNLPGEWLPVGMECQ